MEQKSEYPKWLYHALHDPVVVNDAEQHAAVGPEWAETPDEALLAQQPKRKGK